ncbi:hypothetical protein [Gorillibacterium sp. CAU 1737]|uniref:hypothetical protein n=1 Tax=Gorillibacterium sp. CAU 1737 TaxID=3140362 RepID=UPI0032605FF4
MTKRATGLFRFVFLIPIIFLSFMMWSDYKGYVATVDDRLPAFSRLYYLDEGRKAVGFTEGIDGIQAYLFDTETKRLSKKVTVQEVMHSLQNAVVYQQGALILPTYDTDAGLRLNAFLPSGEVEEIAQGKLPVASLSSYDFSTWRGRLIITGETKDTAFFLAQVKGGQLATVLLTSPEPFPARPIRLRELPGSFTQEKAIPLIEVSLKDDRSAYISGILKDGQLPAPVLKKEEETSFDAQDRAEVKLARELGFDNTRVVRENSEYPGQARFYHAAENKWGAAVPTPKPVYQAKVFPLNDTEVLLVGSTTEDEQNGKTIGYLYQEQTGEFQDVTGLVGQMTYEELDNANLAFFKEPNRDLVYSSLGADSARVFEMKSGKAQMLTGEQVKQWFLAKGEDRISFQSFWQYVLQGNALVINWLIWLLLPLLMTTVVLAVSFKMKRTQARMVAEGSILAGTIIGMEETGTYINEQPLIRFTVRFEDGGQVKEISIKKVMSFLNAVRVGDSVVIRYNRKKNKAQFVMGEDRSTEPNQMTLMDAELRRIEAIGRVNRSEVLMLQFKAEGRDYDIPVVQPPGFHYRIGEKARLALIQGLPRLFSYGSAVTLQTSEQISLQGEVVRVEEYPLPTFDRKLMLLEVLVSDGTKRFLKPNSAFVPKGVPVNEGTVIPVAMRKEDLARELRLQKGKQGAAKVTSVRFEGTLGERPLARITVEREGRSYQIYQSIEPIYGIVEGDELWISYDDESREAIILRYASAN